MKPNGRFIKSVVQTAKTCKTALPYSRGVRRTAFIAKRTTKTLEDKSA